jgi:hypothetical protein
MVADETGSMVTCLVGVAKSLLQKHKVVFVNPRRDSRIRVESVYPVNVPGDTTHDPSNAKVNETEDKPEKNDKTRCPSHLYTKPTKNKIMSIRDHHDKNLGNIT